MKKMLGDAQELIGAGQYEEAVDLLCRLGPPEGAEICELIAKAYKGRNKARGDVYTAKVFAEQAISHGSTDPEMQVIIDAAKRSDSPIKRSLEKPPCHLGGPKNKREEKPAP